MFTLQASSFSVVLCACLVAALAFFFPTATQALACPARSPSGTTNTALDLSLCRDMGIGMQYDVFGTASFSDVKLFQVRRDQGSLLQAPLKLTWPVVGPTPTSTEKVNITLQLYGTVPNAKATGSIGTVAVNKQPMCTAATFGLFADTCGALRFCVNETDGSSAAAAVSARTASVDPRTVVKIEANRDHAVSCIQGLHFAGQIGLTGGRFLTDPVVFIPNVFRAQSAMARAMNEHYTPPAGMPVTVRNVTVYGAAGPHGMIELRQFYRKVGQVTTPTLGNVSLLGSGGAPGSEEVFDALGCDAQDLTAFTARVGRVGVSSPFPCAIRQNQVERACTSVADYHTACLLDPNCYGFTTAVFSQGGLPLSTALPSDITEVGMFLNTVTAKTQAAVPSALAGFTRRGLGQAINATFFEKPSVRQRTCQLKMSTAPAASASAVAAGKGTVKIFVAQTSYSFATVDVKVRSSDDAPFVRVVRCGGSEPFTATKTKASNVKISGRSRDCAVMLQCGEIAVTPGSTIAVTTSEDTLQLGCKNSFDVMAIFASAAPDSTTGGSSGSGSGTATPAPPAAVYTPLNTTGFASRVVTLSPRYLPDSPPTHSFTLSVFGAVKASLAVRQTRFECTPPGQTPEVGTGGVIPPSCPTRPAVVLKAGAGSTNTTTSPETVAKCGGSELFGGALPGLRAQCDVVYDCGAAFIDVPTMMVNATTNTGSSSSEMVLATQLVTVSVNVDFLRAVTADLFAQDSCKGFSATLFVEHSPAAPSSVPVFPLLDPVEGVRPLLAVLRESTSSPVLAAHAAALHIFGENATSEYLRGSALETEIGSYSLLHVRRFPGPKGSVADAYYADSSKLPTVQPNASYACLLDAMGASARCTVPVPTGANQVRIDALQTDFSTTAMTVEYITSSGDPDVTMTVSCGGTQLFSMELGRSGACEVYRTCDGAFLPSGIVAVRVSVPWTLSSGGCSLVLGTLVSFNQRPNTTTITCGTNEYRCQKDNVCIPKTSVCDGLINDCNDGSDELFCPLYILADSNVQRPVNSTVIQNVANLAECRRAAVLRAAPSLWYYLSTCAVVNAVFTWKIAADPARYIPYRNSSAAAGTAAGTGGKFYVSTAALDSRQDYRRCSRDMHCNSNGRVRDIQSCQCECDATHTGLTCDELLAAGVPSQTVALVRRSLLAQVQLNQLSTALSAGSSLVIVDAEQPWPFDGTFAAFNFVAYSDSAQALSVFREQLFLPSTLAAVNRKMQLLTGLTNVVTTFFSMDSPNAFLSAGPCVQDKTSSGTMAGGKMEFRFTCPTPPWQRSSILFVTSGMDSLTAHGGLVVQNRELAEQSNEQEIQTHRTATVQAAAHQVPSLEMAPAVVSRRAGPDSSVAERAVASMAAVPSSTMCSSTDMMNGLSASTAVMCPPSACVADAIDLSGNTTTSASTPAPASATTAVSSGATSINTTVVAVAGCGSPEVTLAASRLVASPEQQRPAHVSVTSKYTTWMIPVSVICIVVLLALACVTFIVGIVYNTRLAKRVSERVHDKDGGFIVRSARAMMRQWLGFGRCSVDGIVATVGATSLLAMIIAGMFIVMFVESKQLSSNAAVLVEFYQSSACAGNTQLRTLPLRATIIPATEECLTLEVVGVPDGAMFGRANCAGTTPLLSIYRTAAACRSARSSGVPMTTVPSACTPASVVLAGAAGYASVSCTTSHAGPKRLAFIAAQCPDDPQDIHYDGVKVAPGSTLTNESGQALSRTPPSPQFDLNVNTVGLDSSADGMPLAMVDGKSVFRTAAIVRGQQIWMTSVGRFSTVGAMAAESQFVGDDDPTRVVTQPETTFTAAPQSFVSEGPTDAALRGGVIRRLPLTTLKGTVPKDDNYPVGFSYGAFNDTSEVTGKEAGPTAHRYVGIEETDFDVGRHYVESPTSEGKGFTMSCWLRATTKTRGFVFAVTDYYENTATQRSPLMDRLFDVANVGEGSRSPWFNETWRAYVSLYADGLAKSLQFIMADPTGEGKPDPVVRVTWELAGIDATNVFNGQWHRISVAIKNEERRSFAVLTVDGRSSLSGDKYRKCIPRRPSPYTDLPGSVKLGRADGESTVVVMHGAVLYVGYLNAAVQGVTFAPKFHDAAFDVRRGTRAMRIHAATPRRTGIIMVATMLFVSALLAAITIIVVVVGIAREALKRNAKRLEDTKQRYSISALRVFTANYRAVPFLVAAEWLKLSEQSLAQVVAELVDSPVDVKGRPKMIMALWKTQRPAQAAKIALPLPSEWNRLLDELGVEQVIRADLVAMGRGKSIFFDDEKNKDNNPHSQAAKQQPAGRVGAARNAASSGGNNVTAGTTRAGDMQVMNSAGMGTAGTNGAAGAAGGGGPGSGMMSNGGAAGGAGGQQQGMNAAGANGMEQNATTTARSMNLNASSSLSNLTGAMTLTVVATLQAGATYVSSFTLVPELYLDSFAPFAGFFTLSSQFFKFLANEPLAAPLFMLVGVGLLLLGTAFVLANDGRRFYSNLVRYRQRRDKTIGLGRDDIEALLKDDPEFDSADSGEAAIFQEMYVAHLMHPETRSAVDAFSDAADIGDEIGIVGLNGAAAVVQCPRKHWCGTIPRTVPRVAAPGSKIYIDGRLSTLAAPKAPAVSAAVKASPSRGSTKEAPAHSEDRSPHGAVSDKQSPLNKSATTDASPKSQGVADKFSPKNPAASTPSSVSPSEKASPDRGAPGKGQPTPVMNLPPKAKTQSGASTPQRSTSKVSQLVQRGQAMTMEEELSNTQRRSRSNSVKAWDTFGVGGVPGSAPVTRPGSRGGSNDGTPRHSTTKLEGSMAGSRRDDRRGDKPPKAPTPKAADGRPPKAVAAVSMSDKLEMSDAVDRDSGRGRDVSRTQPKHQRTLSESSDSRQRDPLTASGRAKGQSPKNSSDPPTPALSTHHVVVPSAEGTAPPRVTDAPPLPGAAGAAPRPHETTKSLIELSFKCVAHKSNLRQIFYTDVYPYANRRTCCADDDGRRCGLDIGPMFCCQEKDGDGNELCGFAVCAKHANPPGLTGVYLMLVAQVRQFLDNGFLWILELIVIYAALALYTPALRVCVMILGCHPVFQCEFPECFTVIDQRFAVAVYLSAMVLLVFGLGFPLVFLFILHQRVVTLRSVFFARPYEGRFMVTSSKKDTPLRNATLHMASFASRILLLVVKFVAKDEDAVFYSKRDFLYSWLKWLAPEDLGVDLGDVVRHEERREAKLAARKSEEKKKKERAARKTPDGNGGQDDKENATPSDSDLDSAFSISPREPAAASPEGPASRPFQPPPSLTPRMRVSSVADASSASTPAKEGRNRRVSITVKPIAPSDDGPPAASVSFKRDTFDVEPMRPRSPDPADPPAYSEESSGAFGPRVSSAGDLSKEGKSMSMSTSQFWGSVQRNRRSLFGAKRVLDHGLDDPYREEDVAPEEWQRFLLSDHSVLSRLYFNVPFNRLSAVPVLTVGRFLLLIPPLLLEPSSFAQYLLICLGEIAFAVAFLFAAPYLSPWMTVVTLMGSVHQFLIVGLQALVTADANDRDMSETNGAMMLAVSILYIVGVIGILGFVTLSDLIEAKWESSRAKGFFVTFGFTRPAEARRYVMPRNDHGVQGVETVNVPVSDGAIVAEA